MIYDPVPDLIENLGRPVVFIAWPRGRKGTKRAWGYLTEAHMTPDYLAKLHKGNIGVALGEKSGGLCAIDIDRDDLVEPFLAANPGLKLTLQTRRARGRVFWLRFTGDYPKQTRKFKTGSGEEAGEFRSNGAQSIVWGTHPDTGRDYTFVVKGPVARIPREALRWPAEIEDPFGQLRCLPSSKDCSHCTEETDETHDTQVVGEVCGEWESPVHTVEEAILASLPDKVHENNNRLFTLARGILSVEQHEGKKFTPARRTEAFNKWYAAASEYLRPDQTKEEYMIEFFNACHWAKYPLGGII